MHRVMMYRVMMHRVMMHRVMMYRVVHQPLAPPLVLAPLLLLVVVLEPRPLLAFLPLLKAIGVGRPLLASASRDRAASRTLSLAARALRSSPVNAPIIICFMLVTDHFIALTVFEVNPPAVGSFGTFRG